MKKTVAMLVLLIVAASLVFAGGSKEPAGAKKIRLGVTIEDFNDVFMRYLLDQLRDEATKAGAEVIAMDGKRDPNEQIKQVENFITQKVDAILIHVIDQTIAPRITKLCNDAKIPLVYVNRKPEDSALQGAKVVAVASPEEVAGQLQAEFVAKRLNGQGNVAILLGSLGSAPQIGRTKGTKDTLAKYPGIRIIREQTANFQRPEAVAVVENWLASGDKIDAIIANNDEMAIGAVLVLEEKKMKGKTVVTGVDATSDALKFIEEGRLDMTVFQNGGAQGRGGVQAALKLIRGEQVPKFVEIPFEPVTKENYTKYKK
ncbi:MAG: substrate-binding domain-containing protein [Spirochaetales bacterium]